MTEKEFLAKLARSRNKWRLQSGRIRCTKKVCSTVAIPCCPITALARLPKIPTGWVIVAKELGISNKLARLVIAAADNTSPDGWAGLPAPKLHAMRQKLLIACKLSPA